MAGKGTWFDAVNTTIKHVVSLDPAATFVMTAEKFVASGLGTEAYDLHPTGSPPSSPVPPMA
jgi:hypothetical protein